MNKPLFTVREAARTLNVARSTIYHWIAVGTVPAIRIGHTVRIHPDVIEQIQHNPVDPEVLPKS